MNKPIEKMKQIVNEMPECKEKQRAKQGIKNLEIFEVIANSFDSMAEQYFVMKE